MAATARHCRACGAEQEMLEVDAAGNGGLQSTGSAGADGPKLPGEDRVSPHRPPVTPATPGLGAAFYPHVARVTAKARRLGEDTLRTRAASSFPGRTLRDIALAAIGGGILALAAACLLAWALLAAFVEPEGLPLFEFARLAVPLALGAPLNVEAQIVEVAARAKVQLPITGAILVPLGALVLAGFLSARWFRPRDHSEAWKLGALIGVPFSVVLTLLTSAFATDLPLPAALMGLAGEDSSLFDLSDEGLFASVAIRASALQTAIYGCLWGAIGGAIGAGLYGGSRFGVGDLRARLTRTWASGARLVAVEGAARALAFSLVVLGALVFVRGLLGIALESDIGVLASTGSDSAIRRLLVLLLAVPTAALAAVFAVHGIGYQAEILVPELPEGLNLPEELEVTQNTFHLWDTSESMLLLVGTALVAYALARGGRRAAHLVGGTDVRGFVRAGATVAIPWLALLLLVRPLASAEVTASGLGSLEGFGSFAPAFGETVLLSGVMAALAGAGGGWVAWKETLGTQTRLTRAFGNIGSTTAREPVRAPAPVPVHHGSATEPAQARAPRSFCDQCGIAVQPTDRFCEHCGHVLELAGV